MKRKFSRLTRKQESKSIKLAFFYGFLTFLLALGVVFFGIPLLIKLAVFLGNVRSSSLPVETQDQVPPSPPIFTTNFEATSSSRMTLAGYAEPGSSVLISLNGLQKEEIVAVLSEKFQKARSLTFCEFKGLTVADANDLRNECRKAGIEYLVAKNTLIALALPESLRKTLTPQLVGTTSVAIDYEEGVVGPKTMSDFAKDHEAIGLKAGVLDDEALGLKEIQALARTPGRNELMAKVLGSVQAPSRNILGCINGVGTKLAGLIRAYHEKLEKEAA